MSNDSSESENVSSFEDIELTGPLTRRVSSPDLMEESSTRRVSPFDPLEGPSTRTISPLDDLEESSTRTVSPLDNLEGPSTRMGLPLDQLKRRATKRISSQDRLEEPSTRNVLSQDPLEGPSTRTVWVSDSTECSLTNICNSHDSVTETSTNESLNSQLPTEQDVGWVLGFWRRHSRQIRDSRFFPCLYVALLAIPCSAGYMGSKYLHLCEGCPELAPILYIMGILGMWIITIQIAAIISKRYFAPLLTGDEFSFYMGLIIFSVCLFFMIELSSLYICEPVFTPGHKKFCVKAFYDYVGYMNVILPITLILLMFIHVPGCFDPAEDE